MALGAAALGAVALGVVASGAMAFGAVAFVGTGTTAAVTLVRATAWGVVGGAGGDVVATAADVGAGTGVGLPITVSLPSASILMIAVSPGGTRPSALASSARCAGSFIAAISLLSASIRASTSICANRLWLALRPAASETVFR